MEKTQLLHEYELLSQHLKDKKMNKHRRRVKKNGKFKGNNKNIKINPISMGYSTPIKTMEAQIRSTLKTN